MIISMVIGGRRRSASLVGVACSLSRWAGEPREYLCRELNSYDLTVEELRLKAKKHTIRLQGGVLCFSNIHVWSGP